MSPSGTSTLPKISFVGQNEKNFVDTEHSFFADVFPACKGLSQPWKYEHLKSSMFKLDALALSSSTRLTIMFQKLTCVGDLKKRYAYTLEQKLALHTHRQTHIFGQKFLKIIAYFVKST